MKITFEFATQDDCLDKMVPSDLRCVVAERDHAIKERDALAAQVAYLTELVKVEAHEAYWEASDSNRADRWADTFDESVKREFEKYWATNNLDSKLIKPPQHHLRQVRADAERDGFIEGAKTVSDSCINSEDEWSDSQIQSKASQHHASILAGKDGE